MSRRRNADGQTRLDKVYEERGLLRIAQVARLLGVNPSDISDLVASGQMKSVEFDDGGITRRGISRHVAVDIADIMSKID